MSMEAAEALASGFAWGMFWIACAWALGKLFDNIETP